jgi:nucleoside-diphosphate-sugar epimerase
VEVEVRYLVTGGAGFIGSHIAERLLEDGEGVRILDDFSTGKRETVADLTVRFPNRLELIEADVAEPAVCERAVAGTDVVFHEAALASVPRSLEDPLATNRANVSGTLNLLLAARDGGVRRFVYAGSSSVYGTSQELPKVESMAPAPASPYALSKLVGEEYTRLFAEHFGLSTVTLRYFNVFGPRQDPESPYAAVIPAFMKHLVQGEPPVIYGDGEQSRDFTYVANVVDANLMAARGRATGTFNIACGARISLLELLARLQEALGTRLAPRHAPARAGDVRHSQADISRAQRELDYQPRVPLGEGLEATVAYFRQFLGS